jgi:sarcosine oxidase
MGWDVVVAGLGGMGSATVLELARRGARVLGLERHGPAHALGSSHGASRIYRQSYLEDPAYVPLLVRAWDQWSRLMADSGSDVFVPTGGLYVGRSDGPTFGGSLRSAEQWDLPHEVLDAAGVARRFPTFRLAEDELALYEERAGYARPEAAVAAQLELAARAGAELRFHEPVLSWDAGPPAAVRTASEVHEAGTLVLTPGAWAPALAKLDVPMVVERQVMHWVAPAGPIGPYERNPVFICGDDDQVYGFPAIDGPDGGVKVSFFRAGEPTDPDTVDRTIRPAEIEELRRRAAEVFPGLTGPSVAATVCLYTTTPDHHFVIGPHPAAPGNVVVACGFSGHGFKFVPVVGEILADLALDGSTRHPIVLFDPRRFRSH